LNDKWDEDKFRENGLRGKVKRNYIKIAKVGLIVGFVVVALVVLSVFLPRVGVSIEIIERGGLIGSITAKISNNNFDSLKGVVVQFGENGIPQNLGDIGPFASVFSSPNPSELEFDRIILTANDGDVRLVRYRN
jgi:asparagine N-glycosylation enzyme membrane subunit Stt3